MIWFLVDKEMVSFENMEVEDLQYYPKAEDVEDAKAQGMAWISGEDYKRWMDMFEEGLIEIPEESEEDEDG
jgi:hypothetical protein